MLSGVRVNCAANLTVGEEGDGDTGPGCLPVRPREWAQSSALGLASQGNDSVSVLMKTNLTLARFCWMSARRWRRDHLGCDHVFGSMLLISAWATTHTVLEVVRRQQSTRLRCSAHHPPHGRSCRAGSRTQQRHAGAQGAGDYSSTACCLCLPAAARRRTL